MPNTDHPDAPRAIAALLALAAFAPLRAADPAPPATAASQPAVDAKSEAVLRAVAKYYSTLPSASVEVKVTTTIERDGTKREAASAQTLAVQRPAKLALVTKSGTTSGAIVSDGKTLSVALPRGAKYAQEAPAPATIEDILASRSWNTVAGNGSILIDLFAADAYERLLDGADAVQYVGREDVNGVPCDHVRFVQRTIDFDVYFAAGDRPLLRRAVADLAKRYAIAAERSPEAKGMTGRIAIEPGEWTVGDAPLPDAAFAFAPSDGAQRMDSLEVLFDRGASLLKDKPAPPAVADMLAGGGRKLDLAAHKGKDVVILDFWATWCVPCQKSLPIVADVAKRYAGKGVAFYAVNAHEEQTLVEKYLASNKLGDLPVAMDRDGAIGRAYFVETLPRTFVIDRAGVVRAVHVGYRDDLREALTKELDAALAAGK